MNLYFELSSVRRAAAEAEKFQVCPLLSIFPKNKTINDRADLEFLTRLNTVLTRKLRDSSVLGGSRQVSRPRPARGKPIRHNTHNWPPISNALERPADFARPIVAPDVPPGAP